MTRNERYWWIVPALLLWAWGVQATPVAPEPVKIKLVGEPAAVVDGEAYDGKLAIVAAVDVVMRDVEFVGDRWRAIAFDPPGTLALRAGDRFELPFAALPVRGDGPFGIRYTVDGREFVTSVNPAAARRETLAGAVGRLVSQDAATAAGGARWPAKMRIGADGAVAGTEPDDADDTLGPQGGKSRRSIRVHGNFGYDRPDGASVPAAYFPYEIYDEDVGSDELLASGTLDADGRLDRTFTWDPCWICDSQPDIYVEVYCQNDDLDVQTAWLEWTYGWDTSVVDDYTGSDLGLGNVLTDLNDAAANMFNIVNRGFRIMDDNGYGVPDVDIQWPGDATNYNPVFEEIHISESREWEEGSYLHEFGHHWHENFAELNWPEYCNGICDDEGWVWDDCGHCRWCNEHAPTSQDEALAHYISYMMGSYLRYQMDPPPVYWRTAEYIQNCEDSSGDPCDCDPFATEGFLFAFLQDLVDQNNENDPVDANWRDRLHFDMWTVLSIAAVEQPNDTRGWWPDLKYRFGPNIEKMWETGMNCGIDFDEENPPALADLHSTDHTVGLPSPDATISLAWTPPEDDASGMAGYSYAVSAGAPTSPPYTASLGAWSSFTSDVLDPGTYYVTMRSFDRSGRFSFDYATAGPFVIRDPYPSDLIFYEPSDWVQELLPYPTWYSETGGPPQPPYLTGWVATYWNYAGMNDGESSISEQMYTHLWVDGVYMDDSYIGGGSPWMTFAFKNCGPVIVPGGLHSFCAVMDGTEVVPETDEDNNDIGFQYTWSPATLTTGTNTYRASPPDPVGGWGPLQVLKGYNCDGYRFHGGGWWDACYMYTYDQSTGVYETDSAYQMRLHQPSTGPTNGFTTNLGWSARPAGCLNAVLVNRNAMGEQDWDVGILNGGGDGSIVLRPIESQFVGVGGSATLGWGNATMMGLYEFNVTDTADGAVSIVLQAENGYSLPLYMAWLDADFTTGDLLDARETTQTDSTGTARFDLDIERTGFHCIAVWRDLIDGFDTLDATLSIYLTPPDLHPHERSNWYAPLTPRTYHANTPYVVSAPDTLYGNTVSPDGTFFNLAAINTGPEDAGPVDSWIYLDGARTWHHEWYVLLSGIGEYLNWDAARSIRGGRHTIALTVDDPDAYFELSEDNNVFGEQWVWGPKQLAYSSRLYRSDPPDMMGGWDQITTGEACYANCDGLRLPTPSATVGWHGVAIVPGDTSDVDIMLYEVEPGAKEGFATPVTASWWGPGQTDYVLINDRVATRRPFDVGLRDGGVGDQGVQVNARESVYVSRPLGVNGPVTMGVADYIQLYDFQCGNWGWYTLTLVPTSGDIEYGLAIHDGTEAVHNRNTTVPEAVDWYDEAGDLTRSVTWYTEGGWFCAAVWKTGADEADKTGSYTWELSRSLTGVGDEPPPVAATRLASIAPNPFNPSTTITFEIAAPGRVRIGIYNARGMLVRALVDEHRAPGRHETVWRGRDDRGRAVASGIYFVRLATDDVVQTRKVSLLQ